jgi:hypothetical protein
MRRFFDWIVHLVGPLLRMDMIAERHCSANLRLRRRTKIGGAASVSRITHFSARGCERSMHFGTGLNQPRETPNERLLSIWSAAAVIFHNGTGQRGVPAQSAKTLFMNTAETA